jgi:altronate dehydratase
MPPRKKAMNRVNPKTAAIRRQSKDPRAQYVAEHFTCQCCMKRQATECHEIVTRAKNAKSILYRSCYLALCRKCHNDEVSDYSRYPVSRQLALKLVSDGDHFNLAEVNRLRGTDESAITLADVARWLRMA